MSFHDEGVTECLVVGSGALGVLLADELSCSDCALSGRISVTLIQRKSAFSSIWVKRVGADDFAEVDIKQFCGSPDAWLNRKLSTEPFRLVVFLCVPPEATESVFSEWIESIASIIPQLSVQFVFCNNGLLSHSCRNLINVHLHVHSFVRAIFFVGARREVLAGRCHVCWNGGDAVFWAGVPNNCPSVNEALQLWTGFIGPGPQWEEGSLASIRIGSLQWHQVADASRLEREKFFTNFVLAASIGPHMQPNESVFDKIDAATLDLLASDFATLWREFGISKESLIENLHSTVRATAKNVNSLSLQGATGASSTMDYFFGILTEELLQQSSYCQFGILAEFMSVSEKKWG